MNHQITDMNILVFRTNLRHKMHVRRVQPHLESIKGISRWNVDLHDIDKVLRIEASDVVATTVEKVLQQAGYFCRELED